MVSIREAAERTGLSQKAIRHYEAIGLCGPSARSESGRRLYSRETLERLRRIQYLRRLKFSLREIGELLGVDTSTVTTRLSRARAKLKSRLGEAWQDE